MLRSCSFTYLRKERNMKTEEGLFGHDLTLILEREECLVIFTPSGEYLILLVNQHGKLVIFCKADVIGSICGEGMAEKVRNGPRKVDHDRFLNYCRDWEVLTQGRMFFELTVLVPASDTRTCTYLSFGEDGKFSIAGGSSVIQSI